MKKIITPILLIIAGASKGLADRISFHFYNMPEYFQQRQLFWNPKVSWKNKWEDGIPENGEAFPFSSTFLVSFTDAWHLLNSIMIISFILAVIFYYKEIFPKLHPLIKFLLIFIVYRVLFGVGFYLTYK